MTIRFTCPSCQKKYALQDHLGGSVVECGCGQRLQLPKPKPAASPAPATSAAVAKAGRDDDDEIALNLSAANLVGAPAAPLQPMLVPEPAADHIPLAPLPARPSSPAPYGDPLPNEPGFQSAGVTRKSGLSSSAIVGIVAVGAVVIVGGALLLFGGGGGDAADGTPSPTNNTDLGDEGDNGDGTLPNDSVASNEAFSPLGPTEEIGPFSFQVPENLPLVSEEEDRRQTITRIWSDRPRGQVPNQFMTAVVFKEPPRPSKLDMVDALVNTTSLGAKMSNVTMLQATNFQNADLLITRRYFQATKDSTNFQGVAFLTKADDRILAVLFFATSDHLANRPRALELLGKTIRRLNPEGESPQVVQSLPAGALPPLSGRTAEPSEYVDPRYAALLLTEQDLDRFAIRIPLGMQPSDVRLPLGQTWSWQAAGPSGPCYFVVNVSDMGQRVSARDDLTTALLQREFGPGSVRLSQTYSNIAQQHGVAFNRAIFTVTSDGQAKSGAFFYYSGVHQGKRLIMAGLAPGVPASNPFYLLLETAARTAHPLP